jgi:hypothetical protein
MKSNHLRRRAIIFAAITATGLALMPAGSAAAKTTSIHGIITRNMKASDPLIRGAREKVFGPGWDNPNVVRGRALANTTWIMDYGGTIIMHDSTTRANFVDPKLANEGNGILDLDDIVATKPDAVLQDHTHFDQQHDAEEIISRTGAKWVTDLGGCLLGKWIAIKKGIRPELINCDLIRDKDGQPFITPDTWAGGLPGFYSGQGLDLGVLHTTAYGQKGWPSTPIPDIDAMAVQIKHSPSFFQRPYPEELSGPNFDVDRSAQEIIKDYQEDPAAVAPNLYNIYAPFDVEGANVGWLVNYKGFKVFHHGSTGPTNSLEPGAAEIRAALTTLGKDGQVDVELGGIAEMTFLLNGNYFADEKEYAKAIGAKQYFPVHHYDWYPHWLTNPAAVYWPGVQKTWSDGVKESDGKPFPKMCYLTEDNYASVWQFKLSDWAGDKQAPPTNVTGPGCYTG